MANKKDLKNSIAAGMTGGLDSLIQPTAPFQEPGQPKKEKAVHCNFVINQSIHTRLKTLAIRKASPAKGLIILIRVCALLRTPIRQRNDST